MADQPITSLPIKTASGMAATDYLLGIDSAEGYQMLIQDLGDYIIQHATSSLAGSNQTLASAISSLDGAWNSTLISSVASLNEALLNSFSRKSLLVNGTVTYALVGVDATSTIYATKVSNTTADLIIYSLGVTFLGIVRYNFSASTVEKIYDVKYEIDTVNDKAFKGGRGSSKDPDTYTTIGYYYNSNYNIFITGLAHRTGYLYVLPLPGAPGYVKQIFSPYNSNQMAIRTQYDDGQGATWTNWEIIPTRAEVDALASKSLDCLQINVSGITVNSSTKLEDLYPDYFKTNYGAYTVFLRSDMSANGSYACFFRHNYAGYAITEIYKGTDAQTPIIDSNGVLKSLSSTSPIQIYGFAIMMERW